MFGDNQRLNLECYLLGAYGYAGNPPELHLDDFDDRGIPNVGFKRYQGWETRSKAFFSAYLMGKKARLEGKPITACPYEALRYKCYGVQFRRRWMDGWEGRCVEYTSKKYQPPGSKVWVKRRLKKVEFSYWWE